MVLNLYCHTVMHKFISCPVNSKVIAVSARQVHCNKNSVFILLLLNILAQPILL
jgi:hypothetical protein